jgi:hypothetical protein
VAKKLIVCEFTNGSVEEMRDKTEWFIEQLGETGAKGFYESIVTAIVARCGNINNIKRLARWRGNQLVQTLVLDGVNVIVNPMNHGVMIATLACGTKIQVSINPDLVLSDSVAYIEYRSKLEFNNSAIVDLHYQAAK